MFGKKFYQGMRFLGLELFIFVFFLPISIHSQITWARTYGGTSSDGATSIHQTTDGGYITAGWTDSFGAGGDDILVLKLDLGGNIIWQKTYGGTGWEDSYRLEIQQTSDGGYIVAGGTDSFGAGGIDFLVLKLKPYGDVEWQKTYGGADWEDAYSVQQTSDGGYIVSGYTFSFGAGGADFWVLKLNSSGNIEWQRTYGYTHDDIAYSIKQTSDGGYIVAGYYSFYYSSVNGWLWNMWILKLNSDGDILWQNLMQNPIGIPQNERAFSILQTIDGGYIVAGDATSIEGVVDFWVLKLDSLGNIIWQKTYGGAAVDSASSVQQTSDGGYIVAGITNFTDTYPDFWVIKIDSSGGIIWQKSYGGIGDDRAYSIQQTSDGGYIVCGNTTSFGTGVYDFLVLKLNGNGNADTSCTFISDTYATPSDTSFTIKYPLILGLAPFVTVTDTTINGADSNAVNSLLCGRHGVFADKISGPTMGYTQVTLTSLDCPFGSCPPIKVRKMRTDTCDPLLYDTIPVINQTCIDNCTVTFLTPVAPAGCAYFATDDGTISTDPSTPFIYFNEGFSSGGFTNDSGFFEPVNSDPNGWILDWNPDPNQKAITSPNYISSFSACNKCQTKGYFGIATPFGDQNILAYAIDISNHNVEHTILKTDFAPDVYPIPIDGTYGSAFYDRIAYIVGHGTPSPHVIEIGYFVIVDMDPLSPNAYKIINIRSGMKVGIDITVWERSGRKYAFISGFYSNWTEPPPFPPPPCKGCPIPTPEGWYPGLLVLDVTDPYNIITVSDFQIVGPPNPVSDFGLALAKNTSPIGVPAPYLYIVAPGANGVMVLDISGSDPSNWHFYPDNDNPALFPVGEKPTDAAYAHYQFPPRTGSWYDKIFVSCLDESQIDPCDSVYALDVQNLGAPVASYPTETGIECNDIPLPAAIDIRADGKYGYVVKGYGGNAPNGIIHVFDTTAPGDNTKWQTINLDPGTNPTRFDSGAYVDSGFIIYNIREIITDAPVTYFDNPSHQQSLLNQLHAVEVLISSNANNTAIIAKLDAMRGDVQRWVTNADTKSLLISRIDSAKVIIPATRQ